MRILVIGATGTIGREVVNALAGRHDVISAARHGVTVTVDITRADSIWDMYKQVGRVDAVVSCAGAAAYKPLRELSDSDFDLSLTNKLMGQVNLVRFGLDVLSDGGSFTLTSGILAQQPSPGSSAISLVNAGIEAFARAAALELPRKQRINVVSPGWVAETLTAMGRDPSGGTPAAEVALAYVQAVTGGTTGRIIPAVRGG